LGFKLCVINPNSDVEVTEYLRETALGVLPAGSKVEAVTCTTSPIVIETSTDDVLASVAVLQAALARKSADAFFVGCFGAPAIAALRETTRAPVVGLGEAAVVQAQTVTSRFGVLTTLERGVQPLWSQLESMGVARSCLGIRAVHPPDGDGCAGPDAVAQRLAEQGRALVAGGADGIVLACAAFSPMSRELAATLDVPVCDGVIVGASIAHGLWASGAWTSKSGAYAWSDAAWAKPKS
jgi:allantoin racemase